MIDKNFVKRKTVLIQRDLGRLKELGEKSFDEIAKDWKTYGLVKNLLMEVIGRAIDINQHLIRQLSDSSDGVPLDYTETFLKLVDLDVLPESFGREISKSAGFRNAVVHGYNDVDEYIIYNSIGDAVNQYADYCDYILKFIKQKVD